MRQRFDLRDHSSRDIRAQRFQFATRRARERDRVVWQLGCSEYLSLNRLQAFTGLILACARQGGIIEVLP